MKFIFSFALLLQTCFLAAGQCFNEHSFYASCYGSGIDNDLYIPPPSNFYSGKRGLTIDVAYNLFTPDAQSAFEYAKQIWQSVLNGSVPVKVNVFFLPLGSSGLLGITFPNGRKNFVNAPVSDVWYPTSLANQLAVNELNVGESDFDIYLNSSANWYFGIDGNCPSGKYDFTTVALHEMCHGLGLVGLSKVDSMHSGSFGLLTLADFSPAIISFPWPELDTLPGIFDYHLITSTGTFLSQGSFPNPSDTLASLFESDMVFFSGTNSFTYNNYLEPKIFAPSVFALGSSMVHLDESTFPSGNSNELMTPYSSTHSSVHNPGPVALAILKDIGWNVDPLFNSAGQISGIDENKFYVDRENQKLYLLNNFFNDNYAIGDLTGRNVVSGKINSGVIDLSDLDEGIYFVQIINGKGVTSIKIYKY